MGENRTMTQEEKQLLLQDLCARLPYGVKIRLGDYDYQVCGYNSEEEMPLKIWYYYDSNLNLISYIDVYLTDYRPYLRPLSSMTEEEKVEYTSYCFEQPFLQKGKTPNLGSVPMCIDWFNKKMFDYRGLIPAGAAIEVTEDDNPYKI